MHGFNARFPKGALLAALALVAMPVPAPAQNLVVNGGFETGDFSDWDVVDDGYPAKVDPLYTSEGVYAAEIAGFSYDPDTVSQQIATTAGQAYRVHFDYLWDITQPDTLNSLALSWNGSQLFQQQNVVDNAYQWHSFTGLVTGTGSDLLRFSAANDPGYVWVDNVSVTGVPEPAAWTMMVAGFSLVGGALRGRRRTRAFA